MKFELTEEQIKILNRWRNSLEDEQIRISKERYPDVPDSFHPYTGAIGGSEVFTFCHTSLGTVAKVKDELTGKEIDLTDYDSW